MLTEMEEGAPAASLAELKAYLRIARDDEDALLEAFLRGAAALCERFIGQWLIVREARETVRAETVWRRLSACPVVAITGVEAVDAAGNIAAVPPDGYAIDIDAAGEGWVRAVGGDARLLRVTYRAGIAEKMDALPEPIRQGIVRLAAEYYGARASDAPSPPPAIVSVLWRPWRRMRLS